MSYLERIHACHNAQLANYLILEVDGIDYGRVQPAFAEQLMAWTEVFTVGQDKVSLAPEVAALAYDERSAAVEPVLRSLHDSGVIDTWVGERYPVTLRFGGDAAFEVERAATSFFGMCSFGVHVNGLVRKADGVYVWTGVRSREKPFWPGQLDQMVAGGQPVGIGLLDNVIKEAQEEANVPQGLAQQAEAVGQVRYRQEGKRGLDQSTIYMYDLWLPEDFVPENTDGEVEAFHLLPLAEVARLTAETTEFKDNCNLVNIDLLIRQGIINEKTPDYAAIHNALYGDG